MFSLSPFSADSPGWTQRLLISLERLINNWFFDFLGYTNNLSDKNLLSSRGRAIDISMLLLHLIKFCWRSYNSLEWSWIQLHLEIRECFSYTKLLPTALGVHTKALADSPVTPVTLLSALIACSQARKAQAFVQVMTSWYVVTLTRSLSTAGLFWCYCSNNTS